MTQTIYGHTYENFRAISDSNTSSSESNNVRTVKLLSPYANSVTYSDTSQEIVNWYNINTEATKKYYSVRYSDGRKLGLTRDTQWNVTSGQPDTSRLPLSRHYWTGSFKTNTSTNDTCFTYMDVGNNVKSDGFLHLLDPTAAESDVELHQARNGAQSAISVNIQFNNLPAFTWVPLVGCTWRRRVYGSVSSGTFFNQETIYWEPDTYFDDPLSTTTWDANTYNATNNLFIDSTVATGWQLPAGINAAGENLYQDDSSYDRWPHYGLHTTYLIYCHDGHGKGMLSTCVGMWPVSSTAVSSFEAPRSIDSDKTTWRPQHAASNAHGGVSGHDGLIQWTTPHTLTDWFDSDTGSTSTRLERFWDEYTNTNTGLNVWGPALNRHHGGTLANSQHPKIGYNHNDGSTWTAQFTWTALAENVNWFMPRIHGQLIAFGDMGNNADLSSPITLYFNRLGISDNNNSYAKADFNGGGFTTRTIGTGYYPTRNAWFGTGKLGDLFFQNVPLYSFCVGGNSSLGSRAPYYRCMIQPGWVIQPTVQGEGQINEFAITSYQPKYQSDWCVFSTSSQRQYGGYAVCVPRADEVFQFATLSGFSASYNPIRTADGDSNRVEVTAGAWLNPLNAVDDDSSTLTTCESAGESNALYIKLEQSPDVLDSTAVIDNVSLNIYGLTVPVISQRALKVQVTDSSKTTLLSGSDIQFSDYSTGTGQMIPPGGIFQMTIAGDNSTTYADISAGYLKLFIE